MDSKTFQVNQQTQLSIQMIQQIQPNQGQPTEVETICTRIHPKDGNGQPLKPVDPNDPTKGYEVPNIPTDPGQDNPIDYVANKANLVVRHVDEKGKDLLPTETTD